MNEIAFLAFLASGIEGIAEYIYSIGDIRTNWKKWVALALAIAIVYTLKIDVFGLLGFTEIPYTWVTVLFTGFSMARGATGLHDILGWAKNKYQESKF